jgi:hypothetical protein
MRSRHQAITLNSKTKKNILKYLGLNNKSTQNEQEETLTKFFLNSISNPSNTNISNKTTDEEALPDKNNQKAQNSNYFVNIAPPKLKKKQNVLRSKIKISSKANIVKFFGDDYEFIENEDKKTSITLNELTQQLLKEKEIKAFTLEDICGIDYNNLNKIDEKINLFEQKSRKDNVQSIQYYLNTIQQTNQKIKDDMEEVVNRFEHIDEITFNKNGNLIKFKDQIY